MRAQPPIPSNSYISLEQSYIFRKQFITPPSKWYVLFYWWNTPLCPSYNNPLAYPNLTNEKDSKHTSNYLSCQVSILGLQETLPDSVSVVYFNADFRKAIFEIIETGHLGLCNIQDN